MDFQWNDEQLTMKKDAIQFARQELSAGITNRDENNEFSHDLWKKCAGFGIQGSFMPAQYGGLEFDTLTTMLLMEGLGYGCKDNGLLFALNAQMWSIQHPLLHFGTDAQKEKYLPALANGEIIGAHGMTEPESGSDAYSLNTRAEKKGDGYVLNGSKTLVTNAPVADMCIVFAKTNPKLSRWGISAFIVEKGTEGFSVSKNMHKMGLRTSTLGELIFQDCYIPEENRLGPEGAGASFFQDAMDWERSCILGSHIGAMERQLEECIAYSKNRRQFNKSIGKFQSVSNRIADMKVRLETARLILYKVAWATSTGHTDNTDSALAKLYVSECFVKSSLDAIRIHGGYGYTTEFEVERDLRDAIGGVLYSGTSDIQKVIIAGLLGL
jgi:L-prolyl-PCP dehydrogenase